MDDIIFGSTNNDFNVEFSKLMMDRFEISMMGELSFFLGFEIKQLRGGIFISQTKYIQDMLKRFKMSQAKPKFSPMQTKCHLKRNPDGKDVDQKLYRFMIGLLLYLCASRPDIVLSVGVCARYQAAPKESHMTEVTRIFDIWFIPQSLGFGTQGDLLSLLWGIRIPIGLAFMMIGSPLLELANSLEGLW